jgi:predicted Zn-dependent protease
VTAYNVLPSTIRAGIGRIAATAAVALALFASGCQQAPITGRNQLVLVSDQQAAQLGTQAYQEVLQKQGVAHDPKLEATVKRVGERIAHVVDPKGAMHWEFNLIKDDTANAFALPGGKVGVNVGLFKVVQNDDQLAAVLGHEIAHVMAKHSAERMSQQVLVQTGLTGLGASGTSQGLVQLVAAAAQLGVILPYTRTQEAEADRIGLHYMAEAGYDPRAAITLWQNMEKAGGKGPPEFLATHPSPGNRIQMIQAELPKVMPIYERNKH